MTTLYGIFRRIKTDARRAIAASLVFELLLGTASPSWAQRRKAEPEANPQFQQQLGAPAAGGGAPVGDAAPAAPSAPQAEAGAADTLGGGGGDTGGSVQGIQIGASSGAKAAAASVGGSLLDARVTVRVKGAPLATFLDTISAQAKINFIITEGLESKRVTAFLQNVTVREALQVLLEIKGLSYTQVGHSNTYIVAPRSKEVENLLTRIYTLSFIPLIPLELTGGGGAGAAQSTTNATEVPIVKVLQSILSKLGTVAIDARTNSLIVTDVPEVFPQIEQIINELDKKAPQIMIEAQVVEIDSDRDKELGLDWGGPKGEMGTFIAGSRDTSFPMSLPNDLSKTRFLDPIAAQVGVIGPGNASILPGGIGNQFVGGISNSVLNLSQLTVALRALVSRTEGRILGKPKILTLNNKRAVFSILRNQATSVQATLSGVGGGGGAIASATIERHDTGVTLAVTPQVNKDGYVTMLLRPEYIDTQTSPLTSSGNPVVDPVTRSAQTMVRVKSGQTLVLGGLLQTTETKAVRKVPFFGYIPLIGWLFSSVSAIRNNTDLVIFITPTIVNN